MKHLLTLLLALFGVSLTAQSDLSIGLEDYQRAESMMASNLRNLVYTNNVRPTWVDDCKIGYNINTPEGMRYVIYDFKKKKKETIESRAEYLKAIKVKTPPSVKRGKEMLSPDEKHILFIKDWNLWMRTVATGKEKQLTFDGVKDYGYATDNAGWTHSDRPIVKWSPDGKKIATYRQDQRHVKDMYLVKTTVGAPELEAWKYPLPGDEKIIMIERIIIDTESGDIVKFDMEPDARRSTFTDDISSRGILGDVEWSKDGKSLAFVSVSRDHKIADLRIADAMTGKVRDIYQEVVPTQYESGRNMVNWRYLPKSNEFIWYSQKSDWGHLYLGDLKTGKIKNQITKGDFVVTHLLHIDEKKRKLYFEANNAEEGRDPYFSHFYSINFDGSDMKLLTPEDGNHTVYLSDDKKYFVDNYSQFDKPTVSVLRNMKGKLIANLEKADISAVTKAGWRMPVPFSVKSDNGDWDLYGVMYLPSNLDESKKYPVVNYIYPGPQGGSVGSRSFNPGGRNHQAMAELGFVVVALDGSCNPMRSKSFHDACYGNMAVNTLPDQISGLQQLAQRYPYMDLDRVGIWGRSGGGFATAAALFKYPEFYKVGASFSGNHDNRNYEDDWGERYIGLLKGDNYELQANQLYAKNLQGKLLIGTGNMDDNVPPYNSWLVVDALIKANKDFDLLLVPHARHGFGEDSNYVTRRIWDYMVEHLHGVKPPKEYKIGN